MLTQPTLDKLETLRLHGMAEAFRAQSDPAQRDGLAGLSFEERFALLVDQEWTWRQNSTLARRLTQAKFRYRASVEDIDFRAPRGLDRSLVHSLTQNSTWVVEHQNIFLLGPCGVGKSWLACALGEKACRDGFAAFFIRTPKLFRELALARANGRLAPIDVLIVDDWAHAPLAESERRDFLEICEDSYQTRSTILTSQLPVAKWHEQIGDPTSADSILDQLVHNAHRIEMRGESTRKERAARRLESKSGGPWSQRAARSSFLGDPGARFWRGKLIFCQTRKQDSRKSEPGGTQHVAALRARRDRKCGGNAAKTQTPDSLISTAPAAGSYQQQREKMKQTPDSS